MTPIETKSAQVACILCDPDREAIEALKAEVETKLADRAATILNYGVSLKRRDGFIAVEVVTGLPGTVVSWLKGHPEIRDYAIYDVPSIELEHEVTRQAQAIHPTPPPKPVRRNLAELEQLAGLHSHDESDEGDEAKPTQELQPDLPPGVRRAIAELEAWLEAHHYRLIADSDTGGLRVVASQEGHHG